MFEIEEDLRGPVRSWLEGRNLVPHDEVQRGGKFVDLLGSEGGIAKVAIELKLANWQRALYQATIYTCFASECYVAMPESKRHLLERNIGEFVRWGVGVLIVYQDGLVEQIIPAGVTR